MGTNKKLTSHSPLLDDRYMASGLTKVQVLHDKKRRVSKEQYLIESLKTVVDGIAGTFGSRCEVVLHDVRNLKNLEHSIVKIVNGHVTGRTVGGPISDRGLKEIRSSPEWNLATNYASSTKDGRPLKSTSILFRDDKNRPIAALCINFDATDILSLNAVIKDIFAVSEEPQGNGFPETFESDICFTLGDMVDRVVRKNGRAVLSMGKEEKMQIVRELDEQGFFLIKGAVKLLAAKLRVSKFTIYNYLEQVRSQTVAQDQSRLG